MHTQKGAAVPLVIAAIAIVGAIVGINYMTGSGPDDTSVEEPVAMEEKEKTGEAMMEETTHSPSEGGEAMMKDSEVMEMSSEKETEDGAMMEEGAMMEKDEATPAPQEDSKIVFTGKRLAGSESVPLLEFNEADYNAALESDKLIALFFYASWCPSCRIEFPRMEKAFDTFTNENVVGFRVNYKDSSTSDLEKDLAKEFGVGYQHTKVFVKDGERILKSSPQGWSTDEYISNINENL